MKNSRTKSCVGLGAILLAAFFFAAAVEAADTGAPVQLSPPPKGAPQTAAPAAPSNAPPTASPTLPPPGTAAGQPSGKPPASSPASSYVPPKKIAPVVESNPLAAIDPDSAGVLDSSQGGFGVAMWAGTSRALVQRLLPQLPVKAPSHAMHDLMRRLLLSVAKAPEGEGGGPNLISLRAERLSAMGDSDGVNQLLGNAPQQTDEALSRIQVNGQFLSDDTKTACDSVTQLINKYTDPYWQKTLAFCQMLSGQKEQARLSVSLLRDTEADKDPAFFTLADFILNGPPAPSPAPKEKKKGKKDAKDAKETTPATSVAITGPLSPLEVAMLHTANLPFPPDAANGADPSVLRAIASNTGADIAARLQAAERAEATGALPATELANVYVDVAFQPEELSNALTAADQMEGARGRALLYQAALKQDVPAARAEALQAAWKLAHRDGVFASMARVTAPLTADITPAPELMWIGADAGRTLFIAGDRDRAVAWYKLSTDSGEKDAPATQAALWPLAVLSNPDNEKTLDAAAVKKWLDAERGSGGDGWENRAANALGLFDALEIPVDPGAWELLIRTERIPSQMPGMALWTSLHDAAGKNRTGAAVLFAMLALGDDGPVPASPVTLQAVVSALDQAGLGADARKLAVEAMAAQ
jgi:hypothetical protein